MKDARKHDRLSSLLLRLVAQYFVGQSKDALITFTGIKLSEDGHYANILFTVFPETQEEKIQVFLKKSAGEVGEFIKEHSRIGRIPFLAFSIDRGEKNRQTIEEISAKTDDKPLTASKTKKTKSS